MKIFFSTNVNNLNKLSKSLKSLKNNLSTHSNVRIDVHTALLVACTLVEGCPDDQLI